MELFHHPWLTPKSASVQAEHLVGTFDFPVFGPKTSRVTLFRVSVMTNFQLKNIH